MIKSFEIYGPKTLRILPKQGQGLGIGTVVIDTNTVKVKGEVKVYFVDNDGNRLPVYRYSTTDFAGNADAYLMVEGWKEAWVEIIATGFYNWFLMLDYEVIDKPKKLTDVTDIESLSLFKEQTKRRVVCKQK